MSNSNNPKPSSRSAATSFAQLGLSAKVAWVIAIVFALIFSVWVWVGVANLVEALSLYGAGGLSGVSWLVFVGSIAAPIVSYGLGLFVARRVPLWAKPVIFLVALAVAMVLTADLEALLLGAA